MADLVVLDFDGSETADTVLTKLRALKKQELIDLLDACIVVRSEDGETQVKQSVNLAALRIGVRLRNHGPLPGRARPLAPPGRGVGERVLTQVFGVYQIGEV